MTAEDTTTDDKAVLLSGQETIESVECSLSSMRWFLILVCTLVWLDLGANASSQLTQPSSAIDSKIEVKRLALD